MCLKIRCDRKSWKILRFLVEVNKAMWWLMTKLCVQTWLLHCILDHEMTRCWSLKGGHICQRPCRCRSDVLVLRPPGWSPAPPVSAIADLRHLPEFSWSRDKLSYDISCMHRDHRAVSVGSHPASVVRWLCGHLILMVPCYLFLNDQPKQRSAVVYIDIGCYTVLSHRHTVPRCAPWIQLWLWHQAGTLLCFIGDRKIINVHVQLTC